MQYSTSMNCGFVKFEGGPYDGQASLEDHNQFDMISFCHTGEKTNHEYVPVQKGRNWVYHYKGAYRWGDRNPCPDFDVTG